MFQYNLAKDTDSYVHRGGRAGRMGRPGSVITLVWEGEEFVLQRQANSMGIEMKRLGMVSSSSRSSSPRPGKKGKKGRPPPP